MKQKLENFVIENDELEQLESRLAEFNLFETLGLQHYEIRHSNTLAYLLSPTESHGLGDYFLKRFLIHTLAENELGVLSPVKVDSWTFADARVRREFKNIDILVCSPKNSLICCIENKILASESQDQLAKYRSVVEQEYHDYKYKIFIFLSPLGIDPSDTSHWLVATYETISRILQAIVNLKFGNVGPSQATFIRHYSTIIGRYLLDNSEEKQLAREIYVAHRQALDYIFKNISDSRQEVFDAVKEYVTREGVELILLYSTLSRVRFTTRRIDAELPHDGDGRWGQIRHLFVFELANNSDSISLALIMGPGDQNVRGECLEALRSTFMKKKYLSYNAALSEMYNTIFKKTLVEKEEYSSIDTTSKVERVLGYLETLAGGELLTLEEDLLDSLKTRNLTNSST